jgi:DNA-binding NarL/FixJ family response regulator
MSADPSIRVLIADDQLLFAEALAGALSADRRIDVVGIAANGEEAVQLSDLLKPDVVLMDLQMPLVDGIEATRVIVGRDVPAPRVFILTGSDEPEALQRARAAGASGYLTKNTSAEAVLDALTGIVSLAAAFPPAGDAGTAREP